MIENVLILDTETTGLDVLKGAKMIEIGVLLYNLRTKSILQSFSTLLPCDSNPVEDINGISVEATKCGIPLEHVNQLLIKMAENAQAIVAHNADFDKAFVMASDYKGAFFGQRWICTKRDFRWPVTMFRHRLEDICQAMGVPYINAHRALNDCNFIAQCFSKVQDLHERMNQVELKFAKGNNFR